MAGTFGGAGRLEFAPTSAPDDPLPVYVDLTPYVRTEQSPLQITRGRQSELDTIQSSQLTCVLDNTDNRFTPGLLTGPYGANWITGKKLRYTETYGSRTFSEFTGYLEFPDVDDWQPIGYQEVQLTAVDRLTRLGRAKPFNSTLGAYIAWYASQFTTTQFLDAWWPLNDPAGSLYAVSGYRFVGPLALEAYNTGASSTGGAPSNLLSFAAVDGMLGDDTQYVQFDPLVNSTPALVAATRLVNRNLSITVNNPRTWITSVWVYTPAGAAVTGEIVLRDNASTCILDLTWAPTGWSAAITNSVGTTTLVGPVPKTSAWSLVTVRVDCTPGGLAELWVNDSAPVTGNMIGVLGTSGQLSVVTVLGSAGGSVGHLQVYNTLPASRFDQAAHLAQYQAGLYGLEQQFTGQRLATILDYAGVPAGERVLDSGVSLMQIATLAGQTPADALAAAVGTERGRGFIDGAGRYVFHDRVRVLNV
jgi:hypothetical protein